MKIVLATSNPNKVKEINEILGSEKIEFVMPPEGFDPIEDGQTFEENAIIKAREANKLTGMVSLADDSGLCVDALNGEPGIHSARYAGTQTEKIDKLLDALKDIPTEKRGAKFVCAMALLDASGNILFLDRGECHGRIAYALSGKNGFGYDPIFIVNSNDNKVIEDLTMAEMSEEDKNSISHRGNAMRKFMKWVETNI